MRPVEKVLALVRRYWRRVTLLGTVAGVLLMLVWPVQAAMLLSFFTAESTTYSVTLRWGTASENNVAGFNIYCKLQDEPESAYHVIANINATGGLNLPATYSFEVTQGVYSGEQYCFRLEEVTTDGVPGERHDICGFGPGVTPTPVVVSTLTIIPGAGIPIIVTPGVNFTPPPTLISPTPTQVGQSPFDTTSPTPFGGATQSFSPLETPSPTFTIFPTATNVITSTEFPTSTWTVTPDFTDDQFGSPLATPTWTALAQEDMDEALRAAQQQADAATQTAVAAFGESPLTTPTFTPTATADMTTVMTLTETAIAMAVVQAQETATYEAGSGGAGSAGAPTPTNPYVVYTATPTPESPTQIPTLTPLPTVTPTLETGLLSALAPSAQNLMVMMLCLIFLSATGLGSLGLLLAVLYFRNQSQRR